MKTKAFGYVAIHQSKALFIRIPSPRFFSFLLKGCSTKYKLNSQRLPTIAIAKHNNFSNYLGFGASHFQIH